MRKELFYRSFTLDRSLVDEEKRSVSLSFSSDTPAKRWYGMEILSHERGAVDLSRLKEMGAVLFNHDPDRIIGPITKAQIKNNRGIAEMLFDEDDEGDRALGKVKSGSLRGVSVGYQILKARRIEEDEEFEGVKGPALIAQKWMPYEISLTPIPLDSTVGVGRDATRSFEGIEIEQSTKQMEVKEMDKEEIMRLIKEAVSAIEIPKAVDIASAVRSLLEEDAKPKFKISAEDFGDLMSRAGAVSPDCKLKVADMVGDGKNADEIKDYILDKATKPDAGDTGGRTPLDDKNKDKDTDGLISSFKQIDDDDFFGGIGNPTAYALN